jgi:two-component system OmpR family response regulator
MSMRILIVEDDSDTREFVVRGLEQAGHSVVASIDGRDGLFQATGEAFDVIIVDRMLPGLDGLALVKALRASGNTTPALMLTAVGGIADRVEGLDAGADDYLIKPFAFSELLARLHALGRRPTARLEPHRLEVGDIVIDLHRRTVRRAGSASPCSRANSPCSPS